MAITIHPKIGQILMCDFAPSFVEPEMVKRRPVVILSSDLPTRANLVTIVCLSSTRPNPIEAYHLELPKTCVPKIGAFQANETWVKGDMIYTVGFHRLDLIRIGSTPNGKRIYFKDRLSRERMKDIYGCVLTALNLPHLVEHV